MTEVADLIVVGAGPAGSATAYHAAMSGLDVALLDRQHFPRDKPCGDGLLPHAQNEIRLMGLGDWLDEPRHGVFDGYSIYGRKAVLTGESPPSVNGKCGYVIPRAETDQALLERARQKGVRFLGGVRRDEDTSFLLGWSLWRRAHQAVAARCRIAKRGVRQALGTEGSLKATAIPPEEARLTDEQWAVVRPLLPPQRGSIGRPPNDHRIVLGGILWVARTGSSWREMPEEYGKWETAYRRHELWVKRGLWRRILRALGEEDLPGPATKKPN